MTADEYRRFFSLLQLDDTSLVVDICSGSGGPAIFMAETTGCHVLGLDINENGIVNAAKLSKSKGLETRVKFQKQDRRHQFPLNTDPIHAITRIAPFFICPTRTL